MWGSRPRLPLAGRGRLPRSPGDGRRSRLDGFARLPAQSLGFPEDLVEPPGDDLPAVLLPLLHQVLQFLDLGLERLDLGVVAPLALVELLSQGLAQLLLDLVPLGVRFGLAE